MFISLQRGVSGILLIVALSFGAKAQEVPSPRGFVNDFAGIIRAGDASQMEALLRQLRDQTGIEIAVVTVASLNGRSIEDYSIDLARRWGVGGRQQDTGLMLLVAPAERQSRIEIGYGLEGDLPDGLAGEIVRRMRPYFRQQAYSQGILLGVNSIVATLAEKKDLQIDGTNPALAYRGTARSRQRRSSSGFAVMLLVLILIVVVLISISDTGGRGGPGGRRRRYYRGSDWLWYPIIFGGGGSGGFGGHRGGGSSWGGPGGGGFGDGGFGGFGGGSFGGGGASDSW